MNNRGTVQIKDEEALAQLINNLIETGTAIFEAYWDEIKQCYIVEFTGGY